MKFLAFILIFNTSLALAAIDLKPGLWKIDMTIEQEDGKGMNLSKQMQEAMDKIPEAQKKEMQKRMGKMVNAPVMDPTKVCYTEEMLKDPKSVSKAQQKEKCDTNVLSQTKRQIVSTFECEEGTKGKVKFNIKSNKSYQTKINVTNPEGEKTQMQYNGEFVSSDCGDVKPMTI